MFFLLRTAWAARHSGVPTISNLLFLSVRECSLATVQFVSHSPFAIPVSACILRLEKAINVFQRLRLSQFRCNVNPFLFGSGLWWRACIGPLGQCKQCSEIPSHTVFWFENTQNNRIDVWTYRWADQRQPKQKLERPIGIAIWRNELWSTRVDCCLLCVTSCKNISPINVDGCIGWMVSKQQQIKGRPGETIHDSSDSMKKKRVKIQRKYKSVECDCERDKAEHSPRLWMDTKEPKTPKLKLCNGYGLHRPNSEHQHF